MLEWARAGTMRVFMILAGTRLFDAFTHARLMFDRARACSMLTCARGNHASAMRARLSSLPARTCLMLPYARAFNAQRFTRLFDASIHARLMFDCARACSMLTCARAETRPLPCARSRSLPAHACSMHPYARAFDAQLFTRLFDASLHARLMFDCTRTCSMWTFARAGTMPLPHARVHDHCSHALMDGLFNVDICARTNDASATRART